jgi:NADPH-dependent 2,4-dienoyl-CoA reductase/sulfur reductase-like enzyme
MLRLAGWKLSIVVDSLVNTDGVDGRGEPVDAACEFFDRGVECRVGACGGGVGHGPVQPRTGARPGVLVRVVAYGYDEVPCRGIEEVRVIAVGGSDAGISAAASRTTSPLVDAITERESRTAVIVGAGYIGLEMAEALTLRGIRVTQIEALAQVLPTVDADLGALVRRELVAHGVEVLTGTSVKAIEKAGARLRVSAADADGQPVSRSVDVVLVVVGVRPDTALARSAGVRLGVRGAVEVDEQMRTGVPHVYAAGDCAVTHHRLLGVTWLPLGTTAHKQGRVAGENAVGGQRRFAGSVGTQVVKVFDLVAARTGLREHEAAGAGLGWNPVSSTSEPHDHKSYYPGATPITVRVTGDAESGVLLGAQLIGHLGAEVAKRVDILAAALFHGMDIDALSDLDLSYTPPLGSPWDALQVAAQNWSHQHRPRQVRTSHTPSDQ